MAWQALMAFYHCPLECLNSGSLSQLAPGSLTHDIDISWKGSQRQKNTETVSTKPVLSCTLRLV